MTRPEQSGTGLLGRARNSFPYLTAFCMDLALGAGLIAMSYMAKKTYNASPLQLGLIALISAGAYVGASLALGRLSDRFGRHPSVVAGCLVGAGVFASAAFTGALWHLYILMGSSAFAMGAFWPALEADISDNSTARQLPRRIGRFNVAWCSGFAVTGLLAGYLCEHPNIGHAKVLFMVAAMSLLAVPIFLARTYDPDIQPEAEEDRAPANQQRATTFWKIALLLNFAAMGANALLRYHVPTVTGGERSGLGGTYLTIVFTAETLTFLFLGRWHGWHYRGLPLAISCFLVAGGGALCGLAPSSIPLFATGCALTGVGCGLIYNSSIYYSVSADAGVGHRGGIHEAALGLGAAVVPYLGGLVAMFSVFGDNIELRKGLPFLTGIGFMALASAVALSMYPFRSRANAIPRDPR